MQPDYERLGVKIGLEIHQQLNTAKLFCSCPSEIRDDEPNIIITRRLRAAAGETGETDEAAKYEAGRNRRYIYHAYGSTTCLVELDEEPIHEINKEAISAALQVAKALGATTIDRIQVMRKTVVDGSNTSGFQRTALVAVNGKIRTSKGEISIPTICIEEESAKIVEATPGFAAYNLSRLGIPLIELATAPEIKTPEHAREAAEHIGMILRSTGKAKRGIGTIRQDVNISIEKGSRVEIKGAQELKLLPKIAETEITRQKRLVETAEKLSERKAEPAGKTEDITGLLNNTESEILQKSMQKGGRIIATKLKGFAGLIRTEIQPGRRLGKEFSEYARRSSGTGGAIHSDELPKHGITEKEVLAIREKLHCGEQDAFILIADQEEKARRGIEAIMLRARQATRGVPKEVRKANPDGTTYFIRPMPGSARMYPETDTPLITPSTEDVQEIVLLTDKADSYEKLGVPKDVAQQISKSEHNEEFEELMGSYTNIEPTFIATTLLTTEKEIRKRHGIETTITTQEYDHALGKLASGKIAREAVFEIFVEKAKGATLEEATEKYLLISDDELERAVRETISQNRTLPFSALIGKTMEKLRGKADGNKIVEALKRLHSSQ